MLVAAGDQQGHPDEHRLLRPEKGRMNQHQQGEAQRDEQTGPGQQGRRIGVGVEQVVAGDDHGGRQRGAQVLGLPVGGAAREAGLAQRTHRRLLGLGLRQEPGLDAGGAGTVAEVQPGVLDVAAEVGGAHEDDAGPLGVEPRGVRQVRAGGLDAELLLQLSDPGGQAGQVVGGGHLVGHGHLLLQADHRVHQALDRLADLLSQRLDRVQPLLQRIDRSGGPTGQAGRLLAAHISLRHHRPRAGHGRHVGPAGAPGMAG